MTTTPLDRRTHELLAWRKQVASDLRQLAMALDCTTPSQLPTPNVYLSEWTMEQPTDDDVYATRSITTDDARAAMRALPGGWRKRNTPDMVSYIKSFGESVRYVLNVDRATMCERIQTGVKHVEAQPAHDVPVYEWRCNEPELDV